MTRKLLFAVLSIITLTVCGQTNDQTSAPKLFPYPEPPKGMENLYDRCTYLTFHFWDKCNVNNAFNKPEQLKSAVKDWVGFMPYASADTVRISINNILERISKSGPNTLEMTRMIEAAAYTDSSDYYSEYIMLPFAKAASNHKKIKGKDREYYKMIAERIEGSDVGVIAHPISLVTATDSIHPAVALESLDRIGTPNILLFFYDPDSFDCVMARARLSADPSIQSLIDMGLLDIIAVYPGEPDDRWRESTASMPANWLIAASPDARRYFDFSELPCIYYLDGNHKIIARKVDANNIVNAMQIMRYNINRQPEGNQ